MAPREFPNSTLAWVYLREKAAATKARELREKMTKEIQHIRGRKFNETIISVSLEDQGTYFSRLESNGIWEQVFKNLTNPSDITSAYHSSEIFRDHLENRRVLMLLPQVIGIIQDRKYFFDDENIKESNENKTCVLNPRLLSKVWKVAVDEQLLIPKEFSEPDWHLRKMFGTIAMYNPYPFWNRALLKNSNVVEQALEILRTSDSDCCACLLKIVEIDGDEDPISVQDKERFYSKLYELLDLHGGHVWSLHFGQILDYESLCNVVWRTPNLKELISNCGAAPAWAQHLSEDDERRLRIPFPFPTIPSLKRVTFFRIPHHKILTAGILQSNPSVKTFSIEYDYLGHLTGLFPALANLKLECFDFTLGEDGQTTLDRIRPLGGMEWPLKMLNLIHYSQHQTQRNSVESSDFFGILRQFNDTLESINLDSVLFKDDKRIVVVHFPKLMNINVNVNLNA